MVCLTHKISDRLDGREYFETPKQELLNQIADEDIRFATYHYSELADHTLRIKATAHFFSLFGAIDNDALLTFLVWKEGARRKAMQMLDSSMS